MAETADPWTVQQIDKYDSVEETTDRVATNHVFCFNGLISEKVNVFQVTGSTAIFNTPEKNAKAWHC